MKYLLLSIIIFLGCSYDKIPENIENEIYSRIQSSINNNEDYQKFIKGNSVWISTKLLSFDVLGWYFQNEIKSFIPNYHVLTFDEKEIYADSISIVNDSIQNHSSYRLFYTEIKSNIVLAEVIESSFKSEDYLSASMFSKGIIFLIRIDDDIPEIVKSIEINHN